MKMIKAIIRPEKTEAVTDALAEEGFVALTKMEVVGRGKQGGLTVGEVVYDELPKSLLFLVVPDQEAPRVCEIIMETARTGRFGDGKIFVSTVEEAYTIRTGQPEL